MNMKKVQFTLLVVLLATILSSCATILGGPRTSYQTTKPADGQPQRQVRIGYIVADVLLTGALGIIIDFATGAIYKPEPQAASK